MGFLLALLLAVPVAAQQISIGGPFAGLNDADATITLDPSQAQDLLNVEVSDDGLAILKRAGYALTDTLAVTTSPVNGAIFFKDASGNNTHLIAQDKFIYKSVNGGVFEAILSTMTVGAKWDFCESAGKVYAFNDQSQTPFSWDGTTFTYYPLMPKASICAITSTRMLLAGATDYPNRLYFSAAGDYTNFGVDIEVDSPSFDDIGLSGEKITALYATESEWLIFKSNSFTSYQGTNQYDLVASVVSNRVGMTDKHAIVQHEGIVYLKGSDNKIWAYTSGTMVDISKKIETFTGNLSKASSVESKRYTATADFDAGTFSNTTSSRTFGSIEPLEYTYTDTTDADFNAGTTAGSSVTVANDEVTIIDFPLGQFPNIGGELGTTAGWAGASGAEGSATYGSYRMYYQWFGASAYFTGLRIVDLNSNVIYSGSYSGTNLISTSGWPDIVSVQIINLANNSALAQSAYFYTGSSFQISGSNTGCTSSCSGRKIYWDIPESHPIVSSATFISRVSTATAADPRIGYFVAVDTKPANSTITYSVRYSSAVNGVFTDWITATNYSLLPGATNHYWQWKADISNPYSYIKPTIYSASFVYQSTGSWISDEFDMGAMTTWGRFVANNTLTGTASIAYSIAVTTTAGTTATATYEPLTSGAVMAVSTGTYARLKLVTSFTAGTETVRTNDLTYSWNFATDKQAYGFEYLGDIYFAVPYNYSTTNNRVMKLDTGSEGWTIFDIPMNYPVLNGDIVKFGSPTGGYVYSYPYGNNDNGAAINSYWKTKDFIGNNPYVEKEFQKMSVIAGSNNGSTLDITYALDTSVDTTYNISLTSSTANFVRNNRNLAIGDTGQFFNLNIGNNAADQPWSFYGASVDYVEKPWRVSPEE